MPVARLGNIAHERGLANEKRVLEACKLEARPEWMLLARRGTRVEDRSGIELAGKIAQKATSSSFPFPPPFAARVRGAKGPGRVRGEELDFLLVPRVLRRWARAHSWADDR
jgi:hypothetical protein